MVERDGLPYVAGALIGAALCYIASIVLGWNWPLALTALLALLCLFFLYFFRSPERRADAGPRDVISPADGRVIRIDHLESYDGFSGPAIRIAIFLSVFDVHVNWTPVAGTVSFVDYHPGKFHLAYEDKASANNERTEIGLKTADGPVVFKQIAGALARRIVCRLSPGQCVRAGEKFGMIKFGSRAEVILPAGSEALVRLKQHVRGGHTILARLAPTNIPSPVNGVDLTGRTTGS
ncbi:MAG: phosphatidylserine decarboxylase family protein [Candidatus Zixiibacteriota bacterium]